MNFAAATTIKQGSLGVLPRDPLPLFYGSSVYITTGIPVMGSPDTVECSGFEIKYLGDTDKITLTILDEGPWCPKWLRMPGRNQHTSHHSSVWYRKALVQSKAGQRIAYVSSFSLSRFRWDTEGQNFRLRVESLLVDP